jgi:hypothetical protein
MGWDDNGFANTVMNFRAPYARNMVGNFLGAAYLAASPDTLNSRRLLNCRYRIKTFNVNFNIQIHFYKQE